jgi:signal transduction histidine kinase
MSWRTVRLGIGVVGTIGAIVAESIWLGSGGRASDVLLHFAIGLTYLFGGLAIWEHAPANRTGMKMTAVGATWFIPAVAGASIPYVGDLGLAFSDLYTVFLLALVLAYPGGKLETTMDRIGIGIMLVGTTFLTVVRVLTTPLLFNEGSNGLYGAFALGILASTLVIRRWAIAPPAKRRDLAPVLVAGGVFVATLMINIVRRIADVPDTTVELMVAILGLAPAAIPVALMVGFYGQSERRLKALMDAIPDPLFRIGRDGRLLDAGSTAAAGLGGHPTRSLSPTSPGILLGTRGDKIVAATTRAIDEGKLQSLDVEVGDPEDRRELEIRLAPSGPDEVTAIVRDFTDQRKAEADVRASRARIVTAGDAERRRLERNLHDGAQQRLVALSLALRRARNQLETATVEDMQASLDGAAQLARDAMTELRELARGIHPAVLTESGLSVAYAAMARDGPVTVKLVDITNRRFPMEIEGAAYFFVSEALANVAKHAPGATATIRTGIAGDELFVEVADDGPGGAVARAGSGLQGLDDRLAAVGGRLEVDSPADQGTRLIARIPDALRSVM